jgi:hypothetical protein
MFDIKNIKVSLKLNSISLNSVLINLEKNQIEYSVKSNYIIFRKEFVYVLFKPKHLIINHVNITKIPDVVSITKSIDNFKSILNFQLEIQSFKIDNLTAVYDLKKEISQLKILNSFKDIYHIKFNKEKFPGLFLRVEFGTFIIFHTGKVNLVGCQDPLSLQFLFSQLLDILK